MLRAVTNWLFGASGRGGRPDGVFVRVGVAYRSEPDQVRAVLARVAGDCTLLCKQPAPVVAFEDFGPSALEFSISGQALLAEDATDAASDLRTRILKAFRAAGIEIPVAQHDIHLRDLDAVRTILGRIAEERAARPAPSTDARAKAASSMPGTGRRETG
jgi:small-conductance mechanosensitive channel